MADPKPKPDRLVVLFPLVIQYVPPAGPPVQVRARRFPKADPDIVTWRVRSGLRVQRSGRLVEADGTAWAIEWSEGRVLSDGAYVCGCHRVGSGKLARPRAAWKPVAKPRST